MEIPSQNQVSDEVSEEFASNPKLKEGVGCPKRFGNQEKEYLVLHLKKSKWMQKTHENKASIIYIKNLKNNQLLISNKLLHM